MPSGVKEYLGVCGPPYVLLILANVSFLANRISLMVILLSATLGIKIPPQVIPLFQIALISLLQTIIQPASIAPVTINYIQVKSRLSVPFMINKLPSPTSSPSQQGSAQALSAYFLLAHRRRRKQHYIWPRLQQWCHFPPHF